MSVGDDQFSQWGIRWHRPRGQKKTARNEEVSCHPSRPERSGDAGVSEKGTRSRMTCVLDRHRHTWKVLGTGRNRRKVTWLCRVLAERL